MDNQPSFSSTETINQSDSEVSRAKSQDFGHVALESTKYSNEQAKATELERKAKSFVRRHGQQLSLFAKDSSLSFVPSKTDKTFSFDAKKFEVNVPLSWFASEQYTEDELDFANHHELAHFIDMRKNPEAYLDNFKQMREEATKLAKDYLQKYPGKTSIDQATGFFYRELHSLYNVLDDIYVNNVVFSRNHRFDYGDGRKSVESLYEKLGFDEADLTGQPLHSQMIISLLRDEMLGKTHGKTIVDERVEAVLSKKKIRKSIRDWVNLDLKPKQGVLVDPAERYKIIHAIIQPEYLELLEISLDEQEKKDQQDKKSDEPQGGENNEQNNNQSNGEGDSETNSNHTDNNETGDDTDNQNSGFDPFNNNKSSQPQDILDHGDDVEKTIKDILESFQESDKIDKMSPEERAKYQNQKKMQEFDDEHNISKEQRQENEKVKNRIALARREMRKFWRGLIGKSIEYRQTTIPHQRKGRLNVNSYIEQYPELIEAERRGDLRKLEIYDRQGLERKVVDQPETIDITLLVDCSGSMGSGTKIDSARATAALLMYSIKDFNGELDATRHQTHTKLRANTEVITFGSSYDTVKYFEKTHKNDSNDAEIITSISKINDELGGTYDALPLADIQSRLTSDEKMRLKNGKLKKIVFEITDGSSFTPEESAARLDALAEDGVLVIGFQIGNVSETERGDFETIWNNDRANQNKKGIYIGEDVSKLPSSLMSALSNALNNIVI